jgi:hypothetical protein
VLNVPERYLQEREVLGFDRVDYGVGGIIPIRPTDLADGQIGYSVTPEGATLVSDSDGEWRHDWFVIGNETACGNPIFLSIKLPYPVFTAMNGQSSWNPKLVAPSLDSFWKCLQIFAEFADGRNNPVELRANLPTDTETSGYLGDIHRLCSGNEDAIDFWVVQAEIGML